MTEENTTEETKVETAAVETENQEPKKEEKATPFILNEYYGVKDGMTRIFDAKGKNIPVTVIKLIPNKVTQIKTESKDGYNAYQVGYNARREKLVNKSIKGHLKKSGVSEVFKSFYEIKAQNVDAANLGKQLDVEASFTPDSFVDVTSVSKGKGFQGVMKKYGFSGGPMTHGSKFHRTGGSIGNRATPGRVFKQKKMPGQMGNKQITTQNLKVVKVNTEDGYLLIKGSVPGHKNSFIRIRKAFKK